VSDQSIVSLATWHGLIVCGTSINGGGGSRPTQRDAKLLIWNPKTRQKEFDIVPVPGASSITDLVSAPNGMVYGIADKMLFEFNPMTHTITKRQAMPFAKAIYNSASVDEAGRIWGLAEDGIFMIDTKKFKAEMVARAPTKITGGFALRNGKLYFISGSAVYCYTI
jgi:ligand-binding sensor domain-containing protein